MPTRLVAAWLRFLDVADEATLVALPRAKRPNFQQIFEDIGQREAYEIDYRFLSAIAHGNPDDQILQYSGNRIRLRLEEHLPSLLLYSTRYYAAAFGVWNSLFELMPTADVDALTTRLDVNVRELAD